MQDDQFLHLFESALERAAQYAEDRFKIAVPRQFKIRLYPRGTTQGSKLYDILGAVEEILGSKDMYPLYIDVAVEAISIQREFAIATAFASQEIVPFNMTWHYADGMGPFKQQINDELMIVPD